LQRRQGNKLECSSANSARANFIQHFWGPQKLTHKRSRDDKHNVSEWSDNNTSCSGGGGGGNNNNNGGHTDADRKPIPGTGSRGSEIGALAARLGAGEATSISGRFIARPSAVAAAAAAGAAAGVTAAAIAITAAAAMAMGVEHATRAPPQQQQPTLAAKP